MIVKIKKLDSSISQYTADFTDHVFDLYGRTMGDQLSSWWRKNQSRQMWVKTFLRSCSQLQLNSFSTAFLKFWGLKCRFALLCVRVKPVSQKLSNLSVRVLLPCRPAETDIFLELMLTRRKVINLLTEQMRRRKYLRQYFLERLPVDERIDGIERKIKSNLSESKNRQRAVVYWFQKQVSVVNNGSEYHLRCSAHDIAALNTRRLTKLFYFPYWIPKPTSGSGREWNGTSTDGDDKCVQGQSVSCSANLLSNETNRCRSI